MEGECLCKGEPVVILGPEHGFPTNIIFYAAVKVRVNDNELFSRRRGHLCHCANCRKVAGGICKILDVEALQKKKRPIDVD